MVNRKRKKKKNSYFEDLSIKVLTVFKYAANKLNHNK